jgi:hypothetical protein
MTAPNWNFGDILDALDASFPGDAPALIHADRVTTWRDFGRRSNNWPARSRRAAGRQGGSTAQPARVPEALAAPFRRGGARNVNYRYPDEEPAHPRELRRVIVVRRRTLPTKAAAAPACVRRAGQGR